MKKILLTIFALATIAFANSGFVCENSLEYKEYIRGDRETLNGATMYPSNEVCKDSCVQYNACAEVSIAQSRLELFPLSQFLTESGKDSVMSILSQGRITTVRVSKDGDERTAVLSPSVDMSLWIPPTTDPSRRDPFVTKTYAAGGVMLEWVKEMSVGTDFLEYKSDSIDINSLKNNWNDMVPGVGGKGIFYLEIDNTKIDVGNNDAKNPYPSLPGYIYQDNHNYVMMKEYDKNLATSSWKYGLSSDSNQTCDGSSISSSRWDEDKIKMEPEFFYDGIEEVDKCRWIEFDTEKAMFIEYKAAGQVMKAFKGRESSFKIYGESYVMPFQYRANFTIDGVKLEMESGEYLDVTNMSIPHLVGAYISSNAEGSKCLMYGTNVNIGGDVLPNLFSNPTDCNSACKTQYNCVEWRESNCRLTGSELSTPVTDYTGKTVYTRKTYDWHCEKEFEEQIDCGKWEIETMNGSFSYASQDPGFETMDFSANFGEAIGTAQAMEQMQHIWSGWEGYCESGTYFDNSWMSDPMQLLSLAMMAYTGAMDGGYGTAAQNATKGGANMANEAAASATSWGNDTGILTDSMTDSIGTALGENVQAIDAAGQAGQWAQVTDTLDAVSNLSMDASSWMNSEILGLASGIASIAMAGMSDTSEADVQVADNYMRAMMGDSVADENALIYANCMASLGLSYVNLAAYSAADINSSSPELARPYEHPTRMTEDQFHTLQMLAGSQVEGHYYISEYETGLLTVTPLTAPALSNIGSAVCTDNMKQAVIIDTITESTTSDNGSSGGAMVNAAIGMALGYLPPPYNLIASVIFKVFTSMSNGNACTDEEIAMKWGLIQAQTQKALVGSQCHLKKGKCIAKWFWGSCMRDRYTYCCYDQETTRIFVEGIKIQLGRNWDSCNDITIYDLQDISFRECKAGENPSVNKCFPSSKYDELITALTKNASKSLDIDRLKDQATESLTLPGQKTPWED